MMVQFYKRREVGNFLGLSTETIREWDNFLEPTIPHPGTGHKAGMYSVDDIINLKCFSKLISAGFSRELAATILKK